MQNDTTKTSFLTVQRAFVVQLTLDADIKTGAILGRVEHVTTGKAQRFATIDELLGFMERTLSGVAHRDQSDHERS